MKHANKREYGGAMIEFALAAPVPIFLLLAAMQVCIGMWSYNTMERAVAEGTRYASTKGPGCSYTGNSCTVTVATIASRIASTALGLTPASLNVTLTSTAGSVSCAPITTCYANTATWPPASISEGSGITITATYPLLGIVIPGGSGIGRTTVGATSSAPVQF